MSAELALIIFVAAFGSVGLLLAYLLRGLMRMTVKRVFTLVVLFVFMGWFVVYCAAHGQAERKSRLINARNVLQQAYVEYVKAGNLPARNGSWAILPYTNQVVVAGRRINWSLLPPHGTSWNGEVFAIHSDAGDCMA